MARPRKVYPIGARVRHGGERWTTSVAGQEDQPDWTDIDNEHTQRRAA